MPKYLHLHDSPEAAAAALAEFMYNLLNKHEGELSVALSGGSTPKLLFEYLAENYADRMDWSRLRIFWGDERCVPVDHADSNAGMAKKAWLDKVGIPAGQIHPMVCNGNAEEAARSYSEVLSRNLRSAQGRPQIDLIILGLGEDGHTASIFPHQMDLLMSDEHTAVARHPESGQERLTLTGGVLNEGGMVAFLVTGAKKAERVAQLIHQSDGYRQLPAAYVQPASGQLHWFLDREASRLLSY